MVGNSESHLKNWYLIFRDAVNAELSPAYDITPLFYYGDDQMGLELAGGHNPAIIELKRFSCLGGHVGIEHSAIKCEVQHTVGQLLEDPSGILHNLPPPEFQERLMKSGNNSPMPSKSGLARFREIRWLRKLRRHRQG